MSLTPAIWSRIVKDHDDYWKERQADCRKWNAAYECNYWHGVTPPNGSLLVETSRCYEHVEGYIASLYSKQPAVVVKADLRARGNPAVARGLANEYLVAARPVIEQASRLALIFPCAFVKMVPVAHEDVYQRVATSAILPWDVVLDLDAKSWQRQRYIGHRYWCPMVEARKLFGRKDLTSAIPTDFVQGSLTSTQAAPRPATAGQGALGKSDDYNTAIMVYEVYDLLADRLYLWSPHYAAGEKWLDDGRKVVVEGTEQTFDSIPIRTADDAPQVTILPLFFGASPVNPMEGYSSVKRIYSQVAEINRGRTFQAAAVRKCGRQWLTARGIGLDSTSLAKIIEGVDGEIIEVDVSASTDLRTLMIPVPHSAVPQETYQYLNTVDDDLARGNILAPFTRGEATNATASEVSALAAYSSAEVGRLARERDALIEHMAEVYVSIMRLYLSDEADVIALDGKAVTVTPGDIAGNYRFYAQDGGATPITASQRKGEFQASIPTLLSLGVPKQAILAEYVRLFDLPETFADVVSLETSPAPAAQVQDSQATATPGDPPAGGQGSRTAGLGLEEGEQPSPERISAVLPS